MKDTTGVMPADALERLEFNKILEWAAAFCYATPGAEELLATIPSTDPILIKKRLDEVNEGLKLSEAGLDLPLGPYIDVRPFFPMLSVQDSVLGIEEVISIRDLLKLVKTLDEFFDRDKALVFPTLSTMVRDWSYDNVALKVLDKFLDEDGQIKEEASPVLKRIRQAYRAKSREVDKVFEQVMARLRKAGSLADSPETMRNGRRVLSVLAEFKRQVRGIIHDESASGKTVFIEPEEVIPINNDLIDLSSEERREIYRIIKDICNLLRGYIPALEVYQEGIIQMDVVRARVVGGRAMEATVPEVKDKPMFQLFQARHPLLLLKNKPLNRKTVPFTFHLHEPNRLMILSGPNAGGKSVTMKAVGLLQAMVQSGFAIPAAEGTVTGIFHNFFADIGDQQSLEDDLSTYSSRLRNMKDFLGKSNERTLVLIDEFGTGTDPKFGGAMAESILYALNKMGVFGIITTHYSNLKQFAFRQKGLLNGSMNFDRGNLAPTYELVVGKPGSSFTFEIAQKVGLPEEVLSAARKKAGAEAVSFDDLLIQLQEDKQVLENKINELEEKQKAVDKLMQNYQYMSSELQLQRKKFKLEVKAQQLHDETHRTRELDRYLREIREKESKEAILLAAKEAKKGKQSLEEEVIQLREAIVPKDVEKWKDRLKVGASVKLVHGGQTGEILSLGTKKAEVRVGVMRMSVPINEIIPVSGHIEAVRGQGVQTRLMEAQNKFESRLDVRGMKREEILPLMEAYLDEAVLAGASAFRIIHGKGSGVLRKAVHEALKSYPHALRFSHPSEEEGGTGLTLVELA